MVEFASSEEFNYDDEKNNYEKVFLLLSKAFGEDTFRKWEPIKNKFIGPFSIASFEVIVTGLAKNINHYLTLLKVSKFLKKKLNR